MSLAEGGLSRNEIQLKETIRLIFFKSSHFRPTDHHGENKKNR